MQHKVLILLFLYWIYTSCPIVTELDFFPPDTFFQVYTISFSPSFVFICLSQGGCFYVYHIFSLSFPLAEENASIYSVNFNIEHSFLHQVHLIPPMLSSLPSIHPEVHVSTEQTWGSCATGCPPYSSWATRIFTIPGPKSEPEINWQGLLKGFNAEKKSINSHSMQEVQRQWLLGHWCLYCMDQMPSGSQKGPRWRRDDPDHDDWSGKRQEHL